MAPRDDDRGQILLLTAFSMVALLGVAALVLDIGFAYDSRNKLAAVADASAKAGAIEIWRNNAVNYAAFSNESIDAAIAAGDIDAGASRTVRLCSDADATCASSTSSKYVEVILSATHSTYLGSIFGRLSLNPTARAVAGSSSGPNCLLTLTGGMTQSNPATGSVVTAEDCNVAVAGDFDVRGTLNAESITAGSCSNGCDDVVIGPPPTDPLAALPTPASADCNGGNPGSNVTVGAATTLDPGTYNDITFNNNDGWLTLNPGIYCITGTLAPTNNGKKVQIDATRGVLVYIAPTGTFQADSNNITLNFTAQDSGPWAGIAMFQDRTNPHDVTFGKNDGDINSNGAIYVPAARITAKNANFASSELCGILVAASIDWDKPNFTVSNDCSSFHGSPLMTVSLAE